MAVDAERDHIQGKTNAPITLVEYGDYECPYCGQAYIAVKAAQKKLGDKLRFVFRNFPLSDMHPHAAHAAEAAEAAGEAGKFWEMHDALYEHQSSLGDANVKHLADKIGIDGNAIVEAIEESTYEARVYEDFMSGVRSGVNGTPTFFINGERYDGSWEGSDLLEALEKH